MESLCSFLLALVHSSFSNVSNCQSLREKQLGRVVYPFRKIYLGARLRAFHFSGALAREARSKAPYLRKIGNSSSRENLVMTSAYEREGERTRSVQILGVEEGRLVVRLTGGLRNAIFSRRDLSEKKHSFVFVMSTNVRGR